MPKITIIPCADKENVLHIGDVFTLVKDDSNTHDKFAVAVMKDDTQFGWVANSANTIQPRTLCAQEVREKYLDNPKCAGVSVVLRREGSYRANNGASCRCYEAEPFLIPVRTSTTSSTVAESYEVGGLSALHTEKNRVLGLLNDNKADTAQMSLRIRNTSGKDTVCVYFSDESEDNKSAGEVKSAPDNLVDQVRKGGVVAKIVKGKGTSGYIIEVASEKNSENKFFPAIDRAVARCAARSSILERRVAHMVRSGFSDKLIEAVLDQTPTLGNERANVPDPRTPYIQSAGTNLADAVAYIRRGKLVQLKGEKGSGKNTLIETACWLLGRPMCRVQGSDDISKMDFEGSRTLKDGSTDFELSEMFRTLQIGGIVVIDEVNMIRANVLADLHSLTDGSRSINVSGYGLVKMDPHACLVYTRNEGYVGTGEMNAATVDRGPVIEVKQETNMSQLLAYAVPTAKPEDINICCKVAEAIQKSIREGSSLSPDAVTVRGYIDALECADEIPLKRGLLHNVAYKLPQGPESAAVEQIIRANCA